MTLSGSLAPLPRRSEARVALISCLRIEITSPRQGDTVKGPYLTVKVDVVDFKLVDRSVRPQSLEKATSSTPWTRL
jgi:hypothetical protein